MDHKGGFQDDELARELADLKDLSEPCPDRQRLREFVSDALPAEEQESIAKHIELCGLCDLAVCRYELPLPAEGWKPIEARLHEQLMAGPRSGTAEVWKRVFSVIRHPALGYAIALVLCIPAYRGLVKKDAALPPAPGPITRQEQTQGLTPLKIVEFPERKRGGERKSPDVRIQEQDKIIGFAFFLPDRSRSGWRYDAEIVNASRATVTKTVALRSGDGLGNFLLAVGTDLLAPGKYELLVRETGPDASEPTELRFPFRIIR